MPLCIIMLIIFSLGDKSAIQDSRNVKLYYQEEPTYIMIYLNYVKNSNQSVDLLLLHQWSTIREQKLDTDDYLANFITLQKDTELKKI